MSKIANEYQELRDMGLISLDQALTYHLRQDHYPPVPYSMIEPCKLAIQAFNEGDVGRDIALPDEVSWQGLGWAPALAVIENFHLQGFLD